MVWNICSVYLCLIYFFSFKKYIWSGFIKERDVSYAIDLMDWCNVLYLNIHPDTLKNFNKNTIIAEVLWEITFNGYSPDDIDSFCTKLKNSFDNCKQKIGNLSA